MAKSKLNTGSTKARPRPTAKSLANLRPAKKGEPSRNPNGARLHNPLTRALQRTTKDSYCEALSISFESQEDELRAYVSNPETPMLKKFVAQAMLKAFEKNDFHFVKDIADRLIGKVGETMTINQTGTGGAITAQIAIMSDADVKARLAKFSEDV